LLFALASASCHSDPAMVGPLQPGEVQQRLPSWKSEAEPDAEAVRGLRDVAPGAEVVVILGTWCPDSRREVPRLWRAIDAAGEVSFAVSYLGVDESKSAPGFDEAAVDLRYTPTVLVKRDGREVGRIVEKTREPIERELWQLLAGKKSGVVTTRTDLGPSS
jgi:thiol-disulfide isomerase/thioredoxin